MTFRSACIFAVLCSLPVPAIPFTLQFTYTEATSPGSNSADSFRFQFSEPTGSLKVSNLSVTLGSGLIYDLTNTGAGYFGWGAYAVNDGGAGSVLTSPPIGEGSSGNRLASWDLASFTDGVEFGFQADIDENGFCSPGPSSAVCRFSVDGVSPLEFALRGAVDVAFTIAGLDGSLIQTYSFPASGQVFTISQSTATAIYSSDAVTPEPGSLVLGLSTIALCAFYHRRQRRDMIGNGR